MFWLSFKKQKMPWWLEIQTKAPRCTYYFGPFENAREARAHRMGYVEDLRSEQAVGIAVKVKRCEPSILTIIDETPTPQR
jgi:hypothetical protein